MFRKRFVVPLSLILLGAPLPAVGAETAKPQAPTISFSLDRNYTVVFDQKTGGEVVATIATTTTGGAASQITVPGHNLINPVVLKRSVVPSQFRTEIVGITDFPVSKVSIQPVRTQPVNVTTGADSAWGQFVPGNYTLGDIRLTSRPAVAAETAKPSRPTISFSFASGASFTVAYDQKTGGEVVAAIATTTTGGGASQIFVPGHNLINPVVLKRSIAAPKFRAEIAGITDFPVSKVSIQPVRTQPVNATTAADTAWGQFVPGNYAVGDVTLTSSGAASNAVQTWWSDTQAGRVTKKNVTLTLESPSTAALESRTFSFIDCVPVSYAPATTAAPGKQPTEFVLVIRPTRLEVNGMEGKAPAGIAYWLNELMRGRINPNQITIDGTSYSKPFIAQYTLSNLDAGQAVAPQEEVTLFLNGPPQGGPVGPGSRAVQTWWSDTLAGRVTRKNVTLTLENPSAAKPDSRTYVFTDCIPVSYSTTTATVAGKTLPENVLVLRPSSLQLSSIEGKAPGGITYWLNELLSGRTSNPNQITVVGTKYSKPFIMKYTLSDLDASQTAGPQEEVTLFLNGPPQAP